MSPLDSARFPRSKQAGNPLFKWYKIYIVYHYSDRPKLIMRFLLTMYHFGDIIVFSLK